MSTYYVRPDVGQVAITSTDTADDIKVSDSSLYISYSGILFSCLIITIIINTSTLNKYIIAMYIVLYMLVLLIHIYAVIPLDNRDEYRMGRAIDSRIVSSIVIMSILIILSRFYVYSLLLVAVLLSFFIPGRVISSRDSMSYIIIISAVLVCITIILYMEQCSKYM